MGLRFLRQNASHTCCRGISEAFRKAERNAGFARRVENPRCGPCCIPHVNGAPTVSTGTVLFQSPEKSFKAIEIDLEPRRQLKKEWTQVPLQMPGAREKKAQRFFGIF